VHYEVMAVRIEQRLVREPGIGAADVMRRDAVTASRR
jgi:hypothetical protein